MKNVKTNQIENTTAVTENNVAMPAPEKKTRRRSESGFAKVLEAFARLRALAVHFDQTRLGPPDDLTLEALERAYREAYDLQTAVGNARADFRTAALERQLLIDNFDALAAQAVGQLAGRGAHPESVRDARGYVQKIRGERIGEKAEQNPASPHYNPNAKNISASQTSSAAKIQTFLELIDFLEAQTAYGSVRMAGLTIGELRATVETAQYLHAESIEKAADLTHRRGLRNRRFYLDEDNLCDLGLRYKELVKGAYGTKSAEYKAIKAISFKKRHD
ncbi:MAG: hypothetical protein JSS81_23990 [Acidobacteria bacterium]|nr:hypothetical protein [Acidobacteriota bacterium]